MKGFTKIPSGDVSKEGRRLMNEAGLHEYEVRGLTDSDVAGIELLADHTDEVLADLDSAVTRALEAVGLQAEGDCKEVTPVDTGRLRNSITHAMEADGKAVIVGTNVEYAMFVHDRVPYLTGPIQTHIGDYQDIFEDMLERFS